MPKLFFIYLILFNYIFSEIPTLKPNIGYSVDFSEKSQKLFKKIEKLHLLSETNNLSKDEKDFLNKYYLKENYFYNPEKNSIWEIVNSSIDSSVVYDFFPYKIFSSSCFDEKKYSIKNIYDNSFQTAWAEGVEGDGIGEYFEFYLNNNKLKNEDLRESSLNNIYSIEIFNGYVKSTKTFKENNRVKKLKVYLNNVPWVILELKDSSSKQIFYLGDKYIDVKKLKNQNISNDDLVLKFEIMEVYRGTKYQDTCITEVMSLTNGFCFPKSSKVTMSENTYKNIEDLQMGDKVLSYDEKTKTFFEDEIVSLEYSMHNNYIEYDFGDKKIVATDDHPFLSTKGFVSLSPNSSKKYKGYEDIEKIKIGDILIFNDENRELKNIKVLNKKEMGYTITKLKEGNTFIVEGAVVGIE